MRLQRGAVCLITGAASGIGKALATLLAERGCTLVLVDLDQSRLEALAASLQSHVSVSIHVADVGDRERMAALAREIEALHDHLDLLVNNAGVMAAGLFAEQGIDDVEWVVRINLLGVAYGCKFFLPLLCAAPRGHVVNMSSAAGFAGLPGQAAYCASKFGIGGLSEALRAEFAGLNIGVTRVHPGAIRTDMLRSMRATDERVKNTLAMGMERFGIKPERVARAVVRAVERNRREVIIGPDARVISWSKRFMPLAFGSVLERVYTRMSR